MDDVSLHCPVLCQGSTVDMVFFIPTLCKAVSNRIMELVSSKDVLLSSWLLTAWFAASCSCEMMSDTRQVLTLWLQLFTVWDHFLIVHMICMTLFLCLVFYRVLKNAWLRNKQHHLTSLFCTVFVFAILRYIQSTFGNRLKWCKLKRISKYQNINRK